MSSGKAGEEEETFKVIPETTDVWRKDLERAWTGGTGVRPVFGFSHACTVGVVAAESMTNTNK